jgi:hypothetical protein
MTLSAKGAQKRPFGQTEGDQQSLAKAFLLVHLSLPALSILIAHRNQLNPAIEDTNASRVNRSAD